MVFDNHDSNDKRISVQLEATEAAILVAASHIYAAYIVSGQARPESEKEFMKRSMQQAMQMATTIDDSIRSEGEF